VVEISPGITRPAETRKEIDMDIPEKIILEWAWRWDINGSKEEIKRAFEDARSPQAAPEAGSECMNLLSAKWINAREEMPKGVWSPNHPHLSEEVLVANSCAIAIAHYNRDEGCWYVDEPAKKEWIDKITHWMPLPVNPHGI
jgi:hypothetical protein